MKTKNILLVIAFIGIVISILYFLRRAKTKPSMSNIIVYGNKAIYYKDGKNYEAELVSFNREGQRSFWGRYSFWYYYDGSVWKLINETAFNNLQLAEELNIPKELQSI